MSCKKMQCCNFESASAGKENSSNTKKNVNKVRSDDIVDDEPPKKRRRLSRNSTNCSPVKTNDPKNNNKNQNQNIKNTTMNKDNTIQGEYNSNDTPRLSTNVMIV